MKKINFILPIYLLVFVVSGCSSNTSSSEQIQDSSTKETQKPSEKALFINTIALNDYFDILESKQSVLGEFSIYQSGKKVFKRKLSNESRLDFYKIGSISKTYTSVLTFKMIEEGLLNLDDNLSRFFPQIKNSELITIDQLLSHQSGIFNYTNHSEFLRYYQTNQSSKQMLERLTMLSSDFLPGEKSEYSNSNYLILGYILESVSQKSYAELLKKYLIEPLQLNHTSFGVGKDTELSHVLSYIYMSEWQSIPAWSMSTAGAAGAVLANSEDLNKFFHSLFSGEIISNNSLQKMTELTNEYGRGIFQRKITQGGNEYVGYWHNGKIEEFNSFMIYFPEQEIGISMLINGINSHANLIIKNLYNATFGQELVLPEKNEFKANLDLLKSFEGFYQSEGFPLDIDIFVQEQQLYAQATGQGAFPLTPLNDYKFEFVAAGIGITFLEDKKGFTIKQAGQSNDFVIADKQVEVETEPEFSVKLEVIEEYVGYYVSNQMPLDIDIKVVDGNLSAQATGQSAIVLSAVSNVEFEFKAAGINIKFPEKNKMLLNQAGREFEFTKKK